MRVRPSHLRALVAPALVAALAACGTETSSPVDHATMHAGAASSAASTAANVAAAGLLKAVKSVSARYHSTTQATKNGYVVSSPCVEVPGVGGMGYHWVNNSLVDPVFDPLNPEVVLYGPTGKLVAVEYIVIDVGQPRPSFNGYPFDIGGTPVPVPHYSLHTWVHFDNPAGVHAPFNPNISCS